MFISSRSLCKKTTATCSVCSYRKSPCLFSLTCHFVLNFPGNFYFLSTLLLPGSMVYFKQVHLLLFFIYVWVTKCPSNQVPKRTYPFGYKFVQILELLYSENKRFGNIRGEAYFIVQKGEQNDGKGRFHWRGRP